VNGVVAFLPEGPLTTLLPRRAHPTPTRRRRGRPFLLQRHASLHRGRCSSPASCRRLLAPRPPCLPLPTASSAPPSNSSKSCPITSRYSLTCIPRSCGDASGACRLCTRRERIGEEAMHLRCGGGLGTTRSTTVRSAPCSCSSMPTWSPATTPTSSSVEIVATCECDWASEGDE
jgi:hypothetical protein